MNKTETAQQLRLAAELIEAGHPFAFQDGGEWVRGVTVTPGHAICERREIRPILATPPDGRPLHNPDGLSAEQVELGWRLTLKGEKPTPGAQLWMGKDHINGAWEKRDVETDPYYAGTTYRLPLSVPWPEVKPDPYAELKAAHAAGKAIEVQMPNGGWFDYNPDKPQWNLQPECYRIKPEPPPFQLPPPPPGMRWHREDGWKAEDLPQGYRPLAEGERIKRGDEGISQYCFVKFEMMIGKFPVEKARTTRALVFQHEGKQWTYHRPGDPMPCDGERKIYFLDTSRNDYGPDEAIGRFDEFGVDYPFPIIGWRYAETTKTVKLGPEDVPPGTVLRGAGEAHNYDGGWCIITSCSSTGIRIWRECDSNQTEITWRTIKDANSEINRSIPLTGRWNPDAWEPCFKTVQIAH